MTQDEMKNLKDGDVVVRVIRGHVGYNGGSSYIIGTDKYGDFGVLGEEGIVYSFGCIKDGCGNEYYECFNPDAWDLVTTSALGYQLQPGDKVIKVSGSEVNYKIGEEYTIGFDKYRDYGVMSDSGNVLWGGYILCNDYIASTVLEADFNPSEWTLSGGNHPSEKLANTTYPFNARDVVRFKGESDAFYIKDSEYTVGEDVTGDFGIMDRDRDVMRQGNFNSLHFRSEEWELVRTSEEDKELRELKDKYPIGSKWVYIGPACDGYPTGFITEVVDEKTEGVGDYGMRANNSALVYWHGCIYSPSGYFYKIIFNPENWVRVIE